MTERRLMVKSKREDRRPAKTPLENINSFLYKLWSLINDETISSIHWSLDGEKLVIENPTKFTAKVLTCNDKQLFKTNNISSFIRQLNLYGFRRVKDNCGKIPLIFKNEYFKQGRPDLLVEVKRKRSAPMAMNKPVPATLSLPTPRFPKPTIPQNQIHPPPRFTPYPNLPTSQPYPYFNNTTAGKNAPMPFVTPMTPFAVNHGPTFINLGSHSTIFSKPRVEENSRISKIEEDSASRGANVQKTESKELYNLKVPNEAMNNPWQHATYKNTLQDRKTPSYNNSMACQAFMKIQGNYQKYPPAYLNSNIFPVPQHLGYRNYGDESMSLQSLRNHAIPSNPYNLPFSPYPAPRPRFLNPFSLPCSPSTARQSPKLAKVKSDDAIVPAERSESKLESFSVFTTSCSPKIICALTTDKGKECEKKE